MTKDETAPPAQLTPERIQEIKDNACACVGPGWSKLICSLVDDIAALGWDGVVLQVLEEKLNGLRFYIGSASNDIFNRIYVAESASLKTCEECGEPGKMCGDHWFVTLCEPCRLKSGRPLSEFDFDSGTNDAD